MGAWGYGPFDNDSARDWLGPIEEKIERTFALALRPLKERKQIRFVFPTRTTQRARRRLITKGRFKKVVESKLTMTTYCQNDALAAVVLVRSLPKLHKSGGWRSDKGNLIEQAAKVLGQLLKDKGHIASWREPKKYVAELEAERLRVRDIVLKYALEKEARVGKYLRQIKRMSKRERAATVRQAKRGGFWREEFETAWERATGKPLPHPPPRPVRPLTEAQRARSAAITKQKKHRRARARLK